jgi:hypothetical protein
MHRTARRLSFVAVVLVGAGCTGNDTGGAIDSSGTAPLRAGVTTTTAATGTPSSIAGTNLAATLAGPSEVPGPGDADGTGTATLTLAADGRVCATITVGGLDTPTAAHIHTGAAGLAGPVLITLPLPTAAQGCVTATAAQVSQVLADPAGYYVNVHTTAFPNGAIRGQLAKP